MKNLLFIALLTALAFGSCVQETSTGIEYENMLGVQTKIEIYQADQSMVGKPSHRINREDLVYLETIYAKPFETLFIELPAGYIKTEYTPAGCWRVLPDIIALQEGHIQKDSLWFALPLWN